MLGYFIQTFLSAGSYYLYNQMYFRLASRSQQKSDMTRKWMNITFVINFIIFYLCSALELELVLNWIIFTLFIFIETYYLCHSELTNAAFLSLQGTICGLSANVFNRCFFAIVLNKNLIAFANNPYAKENIKSIPIILGFLTTAYVFYVYSQEKQSQKLNLMFRYPKHMLFLFKVMVVMMFCLLIHLVLYNYDANDIILKLWGLSSAIFVIVGYLLGLNYTIRLCELSAYKDQNEQLRAMVKIQRELENTLSNNAYLDELTGLYNRQFADKRMQDLFDHKEEFILCFIDLNGLKIVNDQLGHSNGDRYILTVSRELSDICEKTDNCFRYGGDEFIVLFQNKNKQEIIDLLNNVNQHLSHIPLLADHEFFMSVSYGVVSSHDQQSVSGLVEVADSIMYEQKKKMGETRK